MREFDKVDAPFAIALSDEKVPAEVQQITGIATAGQGGPSLAPWSASHPCVNLYTANNIYFACTRWPARGTESRRITITWH